MLQCPETQADRTETGNGAWKVSGTQGRGRPMNCFIYLFIYLSFFEPPPCLCNNCLFLLWQIYPWVLYNSHISLFPVPVLENLINELDMISHPYDISCFKEKFYLSVVDLLQ